jgi:uncharacterized protein (TIGR00266 family)
VVVATTHMDHAIDARPSFAQLTVTLAPGESVRAEAGAMVSHSAGIRMDTNATGGFLSSIKRSVLGGERCFQNTFTADERGGEVTLAPPLPGDVVHTRLDDQAVYVQSGSYLAADTDLDVDAEFGGTRTFFGSEGLFLLRVAGTGPLFLSSYGAIREVELGDEPTMVDTGHVVAFDATADFTVRRVGGLKSTVLSSEGLVCEFEGDGRVWLQTRSQDQLLSWLLPKLPQDYTLSHGQ